MLNELTVLSRSLSRIQTQTWHPWIQTFKKGEALVAELDPGGSCAAVSLLSPEEVARLRNIAPDFHNSFPGFNLSCPLLTLDKGELWNKREVLWEVALSVTPDSPLAYEAKDLRRIQRLLGDFPLLEIAPRLRAGGPKVASTLAVLDRLANTKHDASRFIHQLAIRLVGAAEQGDLTRDFVLDILYGKPNKKKQQLESWKITLCFDVYGLEEFHYRVADPEVAIEWSALLMKSDVASPSSPGSGQFVCALSGEADSRVDDKFPIPNLPVLGPTCLMSMNSDIPCQTRYGMTATGIFPAGRESIQRLNDAILFITQAARRGKTWASVPNGFKDRSDLLIAYLEGRPEAEVPVVSIFADIEPELAAAAKAVMYESRTATIYAALRQLGDGEDPLVRIIALSQIDKGRKQVVFSGSYAASAIYQARDNWLAGSRNAPTVAIPFPTGKGKPVEWRSGFQPSPMQVMQSFKIQWVRAGQSSQAVPGVDLGRIYDLFLNPDATSQAAWLLDRYISLTEPLLIGLSRSLSGGASLVEFARDQALTVVATYGILLFHQGRFTETYMNSRDFLMGQFLQMSDLLHRLYCMNVQKGAIPPQLIGNAAISMAMQRPSRALEVLSTRMMVYLAWAEQFQGEDAGLAKWTRKELGRISALLKDQDLNQRISANGKAELLLGYLANTKRNEPKENQKI